MSRRRAVTLLELLIVMTIMLMVTAAAIPIMIPAMQNRRMREASRLTSSFISGARARAIETKRPAGVMFERFNGLPMAMQLSYVEVPPKYAGETLNSKVQITRGGPSAASSAGRVPAGMSAIWFTATTPAVEFNNALVRPFDRIQLDYKGPTYVVLGPSAGGGTIDVSGATVTLDVALLYPTIAPPPTNFPWSGTPQFVAYQIMRQPVRSSATPLALPDTTVIDLVNSGMTSMSFPATVDPIILFSPNGSAWRVTSDLTGTMSAPSGPIFLLTGRRDLMPDVTGGVDKNLFDPGRDQLHLSNFWITVSPQTGQVSVSENAQNPGDVTTARTFAQSGQSAGGR